MHGATMLEGTVQRTLFLAAANIYVPASSTAILGHLDLAGITTTPTRLSTRFAGFHLLNCRLTTEEFTSLSSEDF